MTKLKALNGWQKLWVLVIVTYLPVAVVLADSHFVSVGGATPTWGTVVAAVAFLWIVPSLILYVFGYGVGWVYRGFKSDAEKRR